MNKEQLQHYEDIALTDKDLMTLLDNKCRIEIYENLPKYRNINQLLGRYGACIILFAFKPHYGHWCLIFKTNNGELEFFNSYGGLDKGLPDETLDYIDKDYRKQSNQDYPYLSELMYNSPFELNYNEFVFQKSRGDIKTCGRHCAVRLSLRHYNIYDYKTILDSLTKIMKTDYDGIVTYLTMIIK